MDFYYGAVASAQLLDGLSQNFRTTLKFIKGHKLACSVCFANVSGSDDDGFAAEQLHLRGFCSERHGAGFIASRLLQEPD